MNEAPSSVTVVLDRDFGDRLLAIDATTPVWIVDTPLNRAATRKRWSERGTGSHLHGVTMFKIFNSDSAEEIFLRELSTIDLHHGIYSADPPYTILDVIGASLTERIKAKMEEFGFDEFQSTAEGFWASRPKSTSCK